METLPGLYWWKPNERGSRHILLSLIWKLRLIESLLQRKITFSNGVYESLLKTSPEPSSRWSAQHELSSIIRGFYCLICFVWTFLFYIFTLQAFCYIIWFLILCLYEITVPYKCVCLCVYISFLFFFSFFFLSVLLFFALCKFIGFYFIFYYSFYYYYYY